MLAQRLIARAGARLSNPAVRSAVQRRLASTDNAFIREREAVKDHAAATTGQYHRQLMLRREPGIKC